MINFYYINMDNATYTSTSQNSSFPVSNLKIYYESYKWKSANSNNNQELKLYYPGVDKNYIIVRKSNIPGIILEGGTIKLQCASNSNFTTGLVTIKNWTNGGDAFTELTEITNTNRAYWRLLYENTAGAVPEVGAFWVGSKDNIDIYYAYPFVPGVKKYNVYEGESLDGKLRISQVYVGGKRYFKLPLKMIDVNAQSKLIAFIDKVNGKGIPFYFYDDFTNRIYLVVIDNDDARQIVGLNYADSELILKEIEVE